MRLEEITYLLDSFNEALKINAAFLDIYKIEVNRQPDETHRVELFMTLGGSRNKILEEGVKEWLCVAGYRKNMGSYDLERYELEDFFSTTDRVVNSFDKTGWFSNWKKSMLREYKLKKIGI